VIMARLQLVLEQLYYDVLADLFFLDAEQWILLGMISNEAVIYPLIIKYRNRLASVTPGSITRICQPREESFPISPILDIGNELPFAENYAGVVDSSLSLVYLASRSFSGLDSESITVTGGGSSSYEVLKRIAGIWGRKVLQ